MAAVFDQQVRRAHSASVSGIDNLSVIDEHPFRSPVHPIPQLQGPFEESILEVATVDDIDWVVDVDAQTRRRDLLEKSKYERLCGRKWRQRGDERFHPLWKLSSQMSFGIHLLVRGLAKSDAEVLRILQNHVDEVDGFLGRTTEDFLIVQIDVRTRIQYLSLPLENLGAFDEMLSDRSFRLAMLDYNEQIELAIGRFTAAINDSLKDIQKAREAIGALWHYLVQTMQENQLYLGHMNAVIDAMLANTEGWSVALSKLHQKGTALLTALCQLSSTITELQRRVGIASRKTVVSPAQMMGRPPSRGISFRGRFLNRDSPTAEKPLPRDPAMPGGRDMPPFGKQMQHSRLAQKSVPNLREAKESHNEHTSKGPPDRSKSAHGSIDDFNALVPKIPKSLSRTFSKARLSVKRPVSGKLNENTHETTEIKDDRPSTAPSRSGLKSRSVSFEHLKSMRKTRNEQQCDVPEPAVISQPERPATAQATRNETMKDQLLQYFKSDRVVDAWEDATTRKEKNVMRRASQIKREGPWSKFRAKATASPNATGELQAKLFEDDLEKQMAWLQDGTEALNTYSLKPRPRQVGPRIHVLSVNMALAEEPMEGENEVKTSETNNNDESTAWDTESLVTALPAVPPTIPESNSETSSVTGPSTE